MLYQGRIEQIACLFDLGHFVHIKSVNCVRITNIDIMKPSMVGAFTAFLFENIPWVGQQVKNNTVTISLQRYHTRRIISKLDGRKLQFCTLNDISHSCIGIYIARYKSLISHVQPKVVEFHRVKGSQTYSVEPLNSLDIPYGLRLKFPERNRDALICKLQSNNCRYEWVAHLDY
eukprot:809866_1